MTRKITKKSDAFKSNALNILQKLGAIPTPNKMYGFCLQTHAGALGISINDHWIACRFDNPAKAVPLCTSERINRHSGKWNWYDGIDDLTHFERDLSKLALPIQGQ